MFHEVPCSLLELCKKKKERYTVHILLALICGDAAHLSVHGHVLAGCFPSVHESVSVKFPLVG